MHIIDYQENGLRYHTLDPKSKSQFDSVSQIIDRHLSEPYSIYVYWFFFHKWSQYCFLVSDVHNDEIIGVIISKVEAHREVRMRGYIGMLVILPEYRGRRIATKLVQMTISKMIAWDSIDEVMLETEVINSAALKLYESLGFLRAKRLYRYYLNTHDAYRLLLPISEKSGTRIAYLSTI
ncbi:hypothetical protein CXQ85_000606 [Candidozyma haemuli]|uniref:N-alpha-acetyltransferase 30 n=1 Tax=Candidozyma haemuli TaxID=45357 RepID=A0A2V1AV26_9ASCO|nr:hypothetical protein CXQ85_000606 [[Candida] haemuloni]PVH21624.1 hypothetical protein CXQ85_000606 [[Candida] haemuloni]